MKTKTHWVAFEGPLRIEVAVPAQSKLEARTIAEKELAALRGYCYQGID